MFDNSINFNELFGVCDTSEDSWDPSAPEDTGYEDDEWIDAQYAQMEAKELIARERRAFEGKRLQGKNAHAYKHDLDNKKMYNLYQEGKSYHEIGQLMGCSPSTVRNRLQKLSGV